MKRPEKISLLTKIMQGNATKKVRQQLRQSAGAGCVIIMYRRGASEVRPDDEVSFHHKGQKVTMPYRDVQAFTRYEPLIFITLPDKNTEPTPLL